MAFKCAVCEKTVRKNQHAVSCDGCEQLTHRGCGTGLSVDSYREIRQSGEHHPFQCVRCCNPPADGSFVEMMETVNFEVSLQSDISASIPNGVPAQNISTTVEIAADQRSEDDVLDISDVNISRQSLLVAEDFQHERSIEEDALLESSATANAENTYSIVDNGSQKGKRKVVDANGFSYVVRKKSSTKVYWRCSMRNKTMRCAASVIQTGESFEEGLHQHCHPPRAGELTTVKVRVEVKQQALQNIYKSGNNIVEQAQQMLIDPDQPGGRQKHSTLVRMANRTREKLRPKEPVNLTFEIVTGFLPADFVRADIRHKGERHIILATDRQLRQLSRSSQWFLDGTFKIVRRPFYQLLTIHAFVRAGADMKMLPLAFVLMSRRRTTDYVKVLKEIVDILPEEPVLKTAVMDFECATWKAIQKVLPHVKSRGCLFHLTQAVWRKCQEIGLQVQYRENDRIHKFVRKLMALPFLPAADIPRIFSRVAERVPQNGKLNKLVEYYRKQWIEHSMFTPRSWSVFNVTVRTNNHVEGWHRRMNNKVGEQTLGIYRLIPELYREAGLVPLQARLVQEGRLRCRLRKQATGRQIAIFEVWQEYKDGDISLSTLLSRCAAIHGPVSC